MRRHYRLTTAAALLFGLCAVVPCDAKETSVDLRPLLPAVQSQGKRNTCNAFAATVLMEYLIQQKTHKPVHLSVAYTYWLGKTKAVDSDLLRGMYSNIDGLAGWLAVKGSHVRLCQRVGLAVSVAELGAIERPPRLLRRRQALARAFHRQAAEDAVAAAV